MLRVACLFALFVASIFVLLLGVWDLAVPAEGFRQPELFN
jgi:hypothetical protein